MLIKSLIEPLSVCTECVSITLSNFFSIAEEANMSNPANIQKKKKKKSNWPNRKRWTHFVYLSGSNSWYLLILDSFHHWCQECSVSPPFSLLFSPLTECYRKSHTWISSIVYLFHAAYKGHQDRAVTMPPKLKSDQKEDKSTREEVKRSLWWKRSIRGIWDETVRLLSRSPS